METYRQDVLRVVDPQHVVVTYADGEQEEYFDNEVTKVKIVDQEDNGD
jgi:hypothetical protein